MKDHNNVLLAIFQNFIKNQPAFHMKKLSVIVSLIMITFFVSGFMFSPRSGSNEQHEGFVIDTLASGLSVPWDIVFLPDGDMLFSERAGRVRLYRNNALQAKPVLTVQGIEAAGKMGLLGMCLHPAFASNHFIYLAYNYRAGERTFLRIARYEYRKDSLVNARTIIENIPGVFNHTGSRLRFGTDRKLYISTGDADMPILSQDLKTYNGKILRINDDGSVPADNPFVRNDTARKEIWSYGHRNPQGLAFQPGTNFLYSSEHGPTGGDEINIIRKGNNYGWPVIHHRDVKRGMISPVMEFTPSIGPAEALFYSGKAFPTLKGHLLVACMRGEAILDVTLGDNKIASYNFLLKNSFGRIRALAEGPDGYLYISTSQVDPPESNMTPRERSYDLVLRIKPAKGSTPPTAALTTAINTSAVAAVGKGRSTRELYIQLCAGCHGNNLEGRDKVASLIDGKWINGGSKGDIRKTIMQGIVSKGMPAWQGVLTSSEIEGIADYILASEKTAVSGG